MRRAVAWAVTAAWMLALLSGCAGTPQSRESGATVLAGGLGVSCSSAAWGRAGRSRAVSAGRLPCWPCWGSLCGRWGWCWAWAAISGQAAC